MCDVTTVVSKQYSRRDSVVHVSAFPAPQNLRRAGRASSPERSQGGASRVFNTSVMVDMVHHSITAFDSNLKDPSSVGTSAHNAATLVREGLQAQADLHAELHVLPNSQY